MDINPKQRVVIIGCGYTGRRLAALCLKAGAEVHGIVRRNTSQLSKLVTAGLQAHVLDFDQPLQKKLCSLENALVFYCLPPQSTGAHDDRRMAAFINLILATQKNLRPQAIIYLSTTGIYGDCRGAWVTESSLPAPLSPRASRRLAAENRLKKLHDALNIPLTLLRVAAIYGPGRLPVETIREGRPLLHESEAPYSNRIHVDDLAQVCIAASLRAAGCQVYNVSDGHPEKMTHYFNRVADLSGLQRPKTLSWKQAQFSLSPGMLEFLKESKKVDNLNMLHELDIDLQYPDLDSGLRASIDEIS